MTRTAQDTKVRRLVLTGLFSALIFVFTAYIHVPTGAGYTHAGDGFIYLAACILPTPYAVAAGMIGGALADGLTGFPVWIPATIVIKAITALFFTSKKEKIINLRNILGILPSLAVCIVGYSLYEGVFMAGGFNKAAIIAAFGQTPFYSIQVAASSVLFIAAGLALDKSGLKKRI
ncbi:TIGR04002 family protein [Ruminococcus flavefaciens]|uniref:TIGR04002 family protein n=1 Tax=Ruminococcus flavefaciens TaxID=1265 RepID=UPI0026EDAE76|nr:TIGR04002 family protein [Ruminococcus flavefaciens]